MRNDAERITALRERAGKSREEIASLAGFGEMEYFDLEFHPDELLTVPSLAKIKRLAAALHVPTLALFLDEPGSVRSRISYDELVVLVRAHLASGITQEAFEDDIGWDLAAFFESEERTLAEYGVEFLQALCARIGVEWIAALP
jgi:transcriptional regulator with XRE-family HTH domain